MNTGTQLTSDDKFVFMNLVQEGKLIMLIDGLDENQVYELKSIAYLTDYPDIFDEKIFTVKEIQSCITQFKSIIIPEQTYIIGE